MENKINRKLNQILKDLEEKEDVISSEAAVKYLCISIHILYSKTSNPEITHFKSAGTKSRLCGKTGVVLFRFINGKAILSSFPVQRKTSLDPIVINRKNKFGLLAMFSPAVNYIYQLKSFWKLLNTDSYIDFKSTYNKFVKKIYSNVSVDNRDDHIMLVLDTNFDVALSDITLSNTTVSVELDPICIEKGINNHVEKYFPLALFLFLKVIRIMIKMLMISFIE